MTSSTKPIILFDMDGTLLDLAFDDFIWNQQLPIRYAEQHGCSIQHSLQKFNVFYQENRQTLKWYSSKHWTERTGIDMLQLHEEYRNRVKYRHNCLNLLQKLQQEGYICWILTNADLANLAFKCRVLPNFSSFFQQMISSESIGYAKEQAEFWQILHKNYPFDPKNAILIDDNLSVLTSAQQFGIEHLLTILQPSSDEPARDKNSLNYPYLDDLLELFDYLEHHF